MIPIFDPPSLDVKATWAADEPVLDFVLPGLVRGTVGNLVAAGGTGKSFVMLATALGVGIGKDVLGIWGEKPKQGCAVFLSLEDVRDELERRLHVLGRSLSSSDRDAVHGAVHIIAASGRGLALAKPSRGGLPKAEDWFRRFADAVRTAAPRLLVIDTLNRLLGGLSENDGGQMAFVLTHLERLAAEARCAIVLCHHASKAALAAGTSNEAHAARGSSVITDNARWQCNLSIPKSKGLFADKKDDERKQYAWLEFAKLNYGPPRGARLLIRGDGGSIRGATPAEHPIPAPKVRQTPKSEAAMPANVFKLPQVADA